MGNDILPPVRPQKSKPSQPEPATEKAPLAAQTPQGEYLSPAPDKSQYPILRRPFYRKWQIWTLILLAAITVAGIGAILWYQWALQPIDREDTAQVRIIVRSGDSSSKIVDTLSQKGLIRSRLATQLYISMNDQKVSLQAGGYLLAKNLGVKEIISHISEGKTDELSVTVLPGLTLKELADPEVKGSLAQQGFGSEEIKQAFAANYDSPLLADRPQGQGLEGYIFPETYRMHAGDDLSAVIDKSLDEMYTRLQRGGIIAKFKSHNLNIHQGVTLASIVQKEVGDPATQRQVAQVFYKRLTDGMALGSDVTFAYAAAQLGVTPAVDIASPYNTRQNSGLPPGPIANMNFEALEAVADPAPGDYVYFVAGDGPDQGQTYFSRTITEHEANIAAHCKILCR